MDKKVILSFIVILLLVCTAIISSGTTDCVGTTRYTTCGSYGCLYIRDHDGTNKSIFDQAGFIDVTGSLTISDASGSGTNDFIIKNAVGTVVAWIDDTTGNLKVAGSVSDDQQAYCTPPANSFIIKNATGGQCVAYIDSSGNVWSRGRLCYGALI